MALARQARAKVGRTGRLYSVFTGRSLTTIYWWEYEGCWQLIYGVLFEANVFKL